MHKLPQYFANTRKLLWYSCVLAVIWTLLIVASFSRYFHLHQEEVLLISRSEARAALERDKLYRNWATRHGGVYVPVSPITPPNPFLSHVSERDITTPSGKTLTLVNPAYMTRQVYELAEEQGMVGRGHLTSLNALRPENRPDKWEVQALNSFERGIDEVSAVQVVEGQQYMRMMHPFVTEPPCLKCHAQQGYKAGDIRGGISVSIPIARLQEATRKNVIEEGLIHGMLWMFGMVTLVVGSRQLSRSIGALQESEERYRTVANFTFDWEYWIAPDRTFRYVSPSCAVVCGYGQEEFYKDPGLMTRIIHPDDLHIYEEHVQGASESENPDPIDYRIITKDGQLCWISHACRTVYSTDGTVLGRRASNRDITDRKRAEDEIRQQGIKLEEEIAERHMAEEQLAVKQLQLEALNQSLETRIAQAVTELRQKDDTLIQQGRLAAMGEMINNIAHQWRQPLNNLGLLIQNMELMEEAGELTRNSLQADVKDAMDMIMFMSRTIDDFRDFFRQDKQRVTIMVKKQVATSLDFVAAMLKDNSISWHLDGEDDVTALGYPNEFSQVLLNILNNARDALIERRVKRPCISVRVFNDNGRAVVTVADNAGGIPPEVLPKVFDPYFTTKEPSKGTGIGLYMSKVIIEKHMSGRLAVRNTDAGAEFRIEI